MAAKPNPRAGDADVLALAESLVTSLRPTFRRSDLVTLKDVVESYPPAAGDGTSEVVASLLGLIGDLIASQQVDRDALAVHIRAWRFMIVGKPGPTERVPLLEGLARVRRLYAEPSVTKAA